MSGWLLLLRHQVRRDRLMLPWWLLGNVLLYWSQAVSVKHLYTTQEQFDRAAASMQQNTAFVAMAGPARALNTVGGQVAWQASAFGAIVAGLLSMFLVGRHTRAEEESGRDELVRSAAIGRRAPLVATVVEVVLVQVVMGALIAVSLISYGLAAPSSWALGVAAALSGLVFAGCALVAAQLTSGTRAMYGLVALVIAAAYVLRAVGDIGNGVLSWCSPIGWGQQMHAFSGLRWWPVVPSIVATLVLVLVAVVVFDRRDIGAGLWPARPGRPRAHPSLAGASALAWRLQRGALVAWSLGVFAFGLAMGTIGDQVGDIVGDSTYSHELFGSSPGSLVDAFYGTVIVMLALTVSGFAISSALRPRGEVDEGRTEVLLSTAMTRWRWWGAHALVTIVGVVAATALGGFGLGLGYAATTGHWSAVARFTGAALPQAAAVLVLCSLAWLLFGVVPRLAHLAWLGLVWGAVVLLFGTAWRMPSWLMDTSAFNNPSLAPAAPVSWPAILVLLAIAAALTTLGFASLRHRDLT